MKPLSLLVLLSIILFLIIAGYQIELPGIYYDELLQMPAAIDLLYGPVNGVYHKFGSQQIYGVTLTLMNLDYIGAVKCYLMALSMGIFGVDVGVLRYTVLAIFVMGLAIFWRFAREEYGETAAAITVVLVASDPGLMMLSRCDNGPIVIAFVARSLTLWLAARWWRSEGKAAYLIGAGFFAGLGFYDKVNFFWFILALLMAGIVGYLLEKRRPHLSVWTILCSMIAGLAASFPFWIYNYYYNWPFITRINQEMTFLDYLTLVPQRTKELSGLINGDGPSWLYFTSGDLALFPIGKSLHLPLFLAALIVVVLVAIVRHQWRLLFIPGVIGLIALQILVTPKGIGLHHWTMIHPLPHLMAGIAIHLIWEQISQAPQVKRRIGLAILSTIILTVVSVNYRIISRYHQLLEKTGGSGLFSAAIYDLSETLSRDYPNRPLQLMDWGLNHTLFFLSSGKLYTNEPFWELVESKKSEGLMLQLIENQHNVFVFNAPSGAFYPEIYHQFHRVIEANGWHKVRDVKIYDRRLAWSYSIVEIEKRSGPR